MTTIIDRVLPSPHFKPTEEALQWKSDQGVRYGVICDATKEATQWDGAPEGAKAIWLERHQVWAYARVTVQNRTQIRNHDGLYGKACQVEFWSSADEGWGEKFSAVLFTPKSL